MEIIDRFVKNNGIIMDFFGGSFSTCIAAMNLNLDYYGTEIDKKVYKAGKARAFEIFLDLNRKG